MNKNIQQIQNEKINSIIDGHLNEPKFNSAMNQLIITSLSNRKSVSLPRGKISEKILKLQFTREKENEILENLFNNFEINNYTKKDLIEVNFKEAKKNLRGTNTNIKKDVIVVKEHQLSELASENTNFDSEKLLAILIEEFMTCDDKLKMENYIGDLSNFDADLLVHNEMIFNVLKRINMFLRDMTSEKSKDYYLIPNIINFFNRITKFANTNVIVEATNVFLNYFYVLVEKFYKNNFDIANFYKLSFDVECLNNLFLRLYDGKDIVLRRIEEEKLKYLIDKFFASFLMNYDNSNPVYFKEENSIPEEFGLSTNFILMLFFCLDNDFSAFKVIFRNSSLRLHIMNKFEEIIEYPFIDTLSCYSSINKKYCFLWKHHGVLQQIFPNKKISKKFLVYCWVSIKLHFLGLFLRYKSLKTKFYENFSNELNCFSHFQNVLSFVLDLLFKQVIDEMNDFEEQHKESLFYLAKEILCDFVLYCNEKECIETKLNLVKDLYANNDFNHDKKFRWLLDDLLMALKDNLNFSQIRDK